jgi:Ca2+-transporting ATPase
LAKSGVLVKSLPAVETLGGVDIICTDKTGTLTEGKFQLTELIPFTSMTTEELWKFAVLACEPVITDSMEKAIFEKAPLRPDLSRWTLAYDYPFENDGKHMSHGWQRDSQESLLTMKGAVEGVLAHCRVTAEVKEDILNRTIKLSSEGFRLLGLAGKRASLTGIRERDEEDLTFLGIIAFSDPIRSSAKDAIQTCQQEGIVVKMITGDHPLTAHAVADQLGLAHSHNALYSGADLLRLNSEARKEAFRTGAIFSRVTPEQKHELVQALKDQGKIIAMTGDGVNDTPALKIADIGISMGEDATDAARTTSKLVLLQNDFNGIVQAVLEGRRIFSSLRKSFSYLVSFHVPIVLLTFIPPALGLGDVFRPIHIILLHLIVHPVSALTFENHPSVIMQRSHEILDRTTLLTSILSGLLVTLSALTPFFFFPDWAIEDKRSFSINVFLFGNIGFILLETFPTFTTRLIVTVLLLLLSSVLIFLLPVMSAPLHLATVLPVWFLVCSLLGIASSLPAFIIRKVRRRQ